MLRIDFWSATGFTLRGGKGGPIFEQWVVVSLIESKRFSLSTLAPAHPPPEFLDDRSVLLCCCSNCLEEKKPDHQTMSNVSVTAWRTAVLWYGWHTGELHPYLTQHSTETRRFPGRYRLLLNHPAGRRLFPPSQLDPGVWQTLTWPSFIDTVACLGSDVALSATSR